MGLWRAKVAGSYLNGAVDSGPSVSVRNRAPFLARCWGGIKKAKSGSSSCHATWLNTQNPNANTILKKDPSYLLLAAVGILNTQLTCAGFLKFSVVPMALSFWTFLRSSHAREDVSKQNPFY